MNLNFGLCIPIKPSEALRIFGPYIPIKLLEILRIGVYLWISKNFEEKNSAEFRVHFSTFLLPRILPLKFLLSWLFSNIVKHTLKTFYVVF